MGKLVICFERKEQTNMEFRLRYNIYTQIILTHERALLCIYVWYHDIRYHLPGTESNEARTLRRICTNICTYIKKYTKN